MASLISSSSGNFTSAATWALAEPASFLDSETGSTASTTSFQNSATFTPGAVTIDAWGVKISSKTSGGTVTVELYNSTDSAVASAFTLNVSDIPRNNWVIFNCGATPLLAGKAYLIRMKTSVAGTVTLFRSTVANWSRVLRLTTTQAPAAGDQLILAGLHTASGLATSYTVTMDNTNTTVFGSTAYAQSINVSKGATLAYGTSASTAYYLKLAGFIRISDGGVMSLGTTSSRVPATSSASLEFAVATNVDSGTYVVQGGTFKTGGAVKAYDRCFLAADASAGATTLTTDVATGWVSGDSIAIAPTERVISQAELKTLSVNASGTTLTVPALSFIHRGTGSNKAEVINLTRNVKIFGQSRTLCTYIAYSDGAVIDRSWDEIYYFGSGTAGKVGVETTAAFTTGSYTEDHCSAHEFNNALNVGSAFKTYTSTHANTSITNAVLYAAGYVPIYLSASSLSGCVFDNIWSINDGNAYCFYTTFSLNAQFTNLRVAGATTGFQLGSTTPQGQIIGTLNGLVAKSCTTGFNLSAAVGQASNFEAYRCASFGISIVACTRFTLTNGTFIGCTSAGISVNNVAQCVFNNISSQSEAGFAAAYSIYAAGPIVNSIIYDSSFGTVAGATNGDLVYTGFNSTPVFQNCHFGSAIELVTGNDWIIGSEYASHNHNGIIGSHKRVAYEGTSRNDTTIYRGASGQSDRLIPNTTLTNLGSAEFTVAVDAGNTCTPTIYVRKSTAGDGTAYNGAQPRLIVRANPAAGITTDTVLATASLSAGTWEALSGTTAAVSENTVLRFYVDCNGTQGWVNIDDFVCSSSDTTTFDHYSNGRFWVAGLSIPSAGFTDIPVSHVRSGYQWKYNSTSNNRTGTCAVPVASDVRIGVATDATTGTYDGSDRWTDPGDANVRLGTAYKANSLTNNKTGRVTVPTASQAKIGVAFETDAATTGTYDGSDRWTDPGEPVVLTGVAYKANSLTPNKTGTFTTPTAAAIADAVWDEATSGHTTSGTFGKLMSIIKNIATIWAAK